MKFVIVGAGAIGRLFGAHLSKCGHEVIFVEPRKEVVEAINQTGVGIMELEDESPDSVIRVPARAVLDGREINDCNYIIIAVKSFDTLAAIKSVAHLINENSPVLSLQTGLNNLEIMEKIVSPQYILRGFTFMAATALGPGVVRRGGLGKTYIGELDNRQTNRIQVLNDSLNNCGMKTKIVEQIIGRLWCKVIVFSAINTVSAILRVKNGLLLDSEESVSLMKRLLDEGKAVAEACSIDLVYSDLYELLSNACRRTSDNLSPMLQDIINKKRTEIDALSGALCRHGIQQGVSVTTHQTMVELITLLDTWGRKLECPC